MMALRIISRLLEYPDDMLWQAKSELLAALADDNRLDPLSRSELTQVIAWRLSGTLLYAQADYCSLFDRGRSLSLLLFEHVHGESRDRGQAMIDLMKQYREAGLELNSYELPDHLPLFLEFLSQLDQKEITDWLKSIAPILALLGARLHQRESGYAALFDVLIRLSGSAASRQHVQQTIREEARDDTPAALDAVWEEEQVRFMASQNGDCGETRQHQQRFSGSVAPQYLDVAAAQPRKEEGKQ